MTEVDFRGIRAAASLKREPARPDGVAEYDFRGIRAAASLKQAALEDICIQIMKFPRHSCRGLIEAR